jgi:integrase
MHGRLAVHVDRFEPVPVTLPWDTSTGELRTVLLYLSTPDGQPSSRPKFNANVWKPGIRRAGVDDDRRNGMHVLRHTYASVLLDAGESIKALSHYLGHSEPGLHPADLYAPAAGQRGTHPPSDRLGVQHR